MSIFKVGAIVNIKEKIKNIVTSMAFIAVVLIVGMSTVIKNGSTFKTYLKELNGSNIKQTADEIEGIYKWSIAKRNDYIDLYGVVQNVLGKSMIGNFEYIKDNQGVIHRFGGGVSNTEDFINDIQIINKITLSTGTPTVYVQVPYMSFTENSGIEIYVNEISEALHKLCGNIANTGIGTIEMAEVFKENGYSPNECFMKTDGGHMTTSSEMLMANQLVSYLENKCGKHFDEDVKDKALNTNNYDIQLKNFVGNFARSSGKYFAGMDKFELIIPKFDTNITVTDYSTGNSNTGIFEEVEMNGYHSNDYDEYTYWVTDYLKYQSPHYEIVNNNVQDNNIMLIMDSTAIRTAAILSLAAHKVTVIDPRYGSYENFIDAFNSDKYDAVFVIQNYTLIFGDYGGLLPNDFSYLTEAPAEVVECDISEEIEVGKTYDFSVTVKNLGENIWNESSRIRLCMEVNDEDCVRSFIENGINVLPGEEYEFKISGFKLDECGDFKLSFRIVQEGISYFETAENGTILVKVTG